MYVTWFETKLNYRNIQQVSTPFVSWVLLQSWPLAGKLSKTSRVLFHKYIPRLRQFIGCQSTVFFWRFLHCPLFIETACCTLLLYVTVALCTIESQKKRERGLLFHKSLQQQQQQQHQQSKGDRQTEPLDRSLQLEGGGSEHEQGGRAWRVWDRKTDSRTSRFFSYKDNIFRKCNLLFFLLLTKQTCSRLVIYKLKWLSKAFFGLN